MIDLFRTYYFVKFCIWLAFLRKYANNLVINPQKKYKFASLQNLQLIFIVILRIFVPECHGQTFVKVELVMFGLIFMKFRKLRKLRSLCRENKKLDLHKTLIFSLFKSFPILLASSIGQKLFGHVQLIIHS